MKPSLQKNSKYHQGLFKPHNPEKYVGDVGNIIFRSSFELKFMNWCDRTPAVLQWGSESITIPYISPLDKKPHRYYPDFIIKVKLSNGLERVQLIEIKPDSQTKPPVMTAKKKTKKFLLEEAIYVVNLAKWDAATEFALKHDMDFIKIDEYDLGLKQRKT